MVVFTKCVDIAIDRVMTVLCGKIQATTTDHPSRSLVSERQAIPHLSKGIHLSTPVERTVCTNCILDVDLLIMWDIWQLIAFRQLGIEYRRHDNPAFNSYNDVS